MNKKQKWLAAAGIVVVCAVGFTFWQKDTSTPMNDASTVAQNTESAQKVWQQKANKVKWASIE